MRCANGVQQYRIKIFIKEELGMKFTNTKAQVKEVGTNAVAFGKAGYALVKSIVKVPVAVGKDVSDNVKTAREARRLYQEWLDKQSQPEEE
jgi:hypothetical protein